MSYEEEDFERILEWDEWSRNTETVVIDGQEMMMMHPSFRLLQHSLLQMEQMVQDIEFAKDGQFYKFKENERGKQLAVPRALGNRYYRPLKTFYRLHAFSNSYVFSPRVEAVIEALQAAGLHPNNFVFGEPSYLDPVVGKLHAEIANEVGGKIAEIVGSQGFKNRLRARKRNAERNLAKGLAIEQQVFANKSRALVLMLTFGYQDEYRHNVTPEELQQHRKKFFNNCRSNKLLRGICDYIWKVEDGDESCLHLHVLIFYTAESCHDVLIAKMIGEYWVKLTEGKGQYWNSNADKAFHIQYGFGVGTGVINWDDHDKREALRKVVGYMTKADQYLRAKCGDHCHLFGTSQVREKRKPGRPRNTRSVASAAGDVSADTSDASVCSGQMDAAQDE